LDPRNITTPSGEIGGLFDYDACYRAVLLGTHVEYKPNSITLAGSELAPNMFGASSELVRMALNQLV